MVCIHSQKLNPEIHIQKAYRPFEIEAFIGIKSEEKARQLEKYFKTGSGKAVLKKRVLTGEEYNQRSSEGA